MKKSFQFYIRSLHRDLGFLTIGLVIFFSLSGIILIYRDTDLMKQDVVVEKTLPQNLSADNLTAELKLKSLKIVNEDDTTIVFTNGRYSKISGLTTYTSSQVIFPFNKFISLHKVVSQNSSHWIVLLFGIILLFMAVSSFWMFKSGTKQFKRGVLLTTVGVVISIVILFIV